MTIHLEEKGFKEISKKTGYYWILETITGKIDVEDHSTEYFPSCSENGLIQEIKEEILEKINSEDIFGFPYTPKEGDYLSIRSNTKKQEYLNLIFLENSWVEEIYTCTYRNCDEDIYAKLKTGAVILKEGKSI
jgi:hypothetical protein